MNRQQMKQFLNTLAEDEMSYDPQTLEKYLQEINCWVDTLSDEQCEEIDSTGALYDAHKEFHSKIRQTMTSLQRVGKELNITGLMDEYIEASHQNHYDQWHIRFDMFPQTYMLSILNEFIETLSELVELNGQVVDLVMTNRRNK